MSEASPITIRRANKIHQVTALQTEYSLWSREPELEILNTVRELGIGFVAYSPLSRGFLTGRYNSIDDFEENDYRRYAPRFQRENFKKNLELVDKVKKIAIRKNITPGQLAIAWVLSQGKDIVPIPGTKHIKYLEENVKSVDTKLTDDELKEIESVIPIDKVAGKRYNQIGMKLVNN